MAIQFNECQNEKQLHSSLQPGSCATACCVKLMICDLICIKAGPGCT